MEKHFTHLHLHTEYSLLDGAISLDKLIEYGKKFNFKALAISDHGNIFGAVKFFQKCKAAGIKPVLGMEAYFTENAQIKDAENKYYHLLIIVQNQQGYRNLCKLNAFAYQEGFYFKPRIDYQILEQYSEGLIITSACLGGHIPKLLMQSDEHKAEEKIDWFLRVFGRDRFYLEVQPDEQEEQKILNKKLFALSTKKNIQLVAAGDCHYPSLDDHEAHEIMLAIQTHDLMENKDRYTFGACRVPMRSTEEMLALFPNHQQAVWNAGKIADMCDFDFETGKLFFPKFPIPEKQTPEQYFIDACNQGLDRIINNNLIDSNVIETYKIRLKIEMDLIIKMGFVGYFLVVSDFIQWAYKQKIPVGPGRGSAAGSLVAWTLQITNIDPIKYNLLFERFLNPERISMPDIDIDFCIEGRERVIHYITEKYGHENVCHIITFGTMMAKGVIKDVARVLGFPFEDSNAITSLIPDQLKITLREALEHEPQLKELIEKNQKAKRLFDIAFKLEGLTRHASKHAAGIVISPEPVAQVLPLYVPPKTTELVSQYGMTELESIGFLKIDLLGLKNLTLIDKTVQLIKKLYSITIFIDTLPMNDQKTFDLLSKGTTSGVFQLESDGLKDVLRKLKPSRFEDIIAVNALYRPGPLGSGMVDDFIERKNGRQKIQYIFPELAQVLQETYGVIVYQEQVMKIASLIGGYSLGQADILRRAMGKKKAEEMQKQEGIFVSKSVERGFNEKKAKELFELMAYFAGYGFNKSHSAAYALIAYQTAYLKANYPAAFMASLISLEATNSEKMIFYLQEAKSLGIDIVPPSINYSMIQFTVDNQKLLFGLQGIKNVGTVCLENIIGERSAHGLFKDLSDFCKRVDLRTANKRVIEHLIYAGAFDCTNTNRAYLMSILDSVIEQALQHKKDSMTGQLGIFNTKKTDLELATKATSDNSAWSLQEKLEKEKEVMGFYLSAHPLDYLNQTTLYIKFFQINYILNAIQEKKTIPSQITICVLIKNFKIITTKKGSKMAFLSVEDKTGTAEVIVFPTVFLKTQKLIEEKSILIITGSIDSDAAPVCKIKAETIKDPSTIYEASDQIKMITFNLGHENIEDKAKTLNSLAKGNIPVEIVVNHENKQFKIASKRKVTFTKKELDSIAQENISIAITL